MKKLIVLSLVLTVGSLAGAGLDLSMIPGLSYEVSGNTLTLSGANISRLTLILQADDSSVLSDVQCLLPNVFIPEYPPFVWFESERQLAGVAELTTPYYTGYTGGILSFNFQSSATAINFVYSSLFGSSEVIIGPEVIPLEGYSMVVPEPVTMVLLGLGGVFLTRRRK